MDGIDSGKNWFGAFRIIIFTAIVIACLKYSEGEERRVIRENTQKAVHTLNEVGRVHSQRLEKLEEEISNLKNEIAEQKKFYQQVSAREKSQVNDSCRRRKWKVWNDLKNKIENEENFDQELQIFYSEFSGDTELISLIQKLLDGVDVITTAEGNSNELVDTCKKYIKKIVRIKKVDYKLLLDISGYVLSSLESYGEN